MDKTFYPATLRGNVAAPASKSEAHRRMICAGLTGEETTLTGFMDSADMEATQRCLEALGASFARRGDTVTIRGGARAPQPVPVMDCGESGSTLRFFVPIALSLTGGAVFRMHGRLGQRPMDIYRDLFVPRGVMWRMGVGADGAAELTVRGRMQPGAYVLPGNVSSQFVSGLLFALPLLQGDSTLEVTPPVESAGYIAMTLEALAASGITLEETAPFCWQIPGGQAYHARSGCLSGDYSQAAVLLCAGALGHDLQVTRLARQTTQGDRAVLDHLYALGAEVDENDEGIHVTGGRLRGTVLDMHDRLTHCGRLRLKECDRLTATVSLLNSLGGCARVEGDDMVIRGVEALRGGVTVDGCGDHRMVMLAAIAATVCRERVTVTGVEALNKSWPEFLQVYASLGGRVE